MFVKSARYYDEIYRQFKDYGDECAKIADAIRKALPRARTILDVACGTGEHAKILKDRFGFNIDGIDLDRGLIEVASSKNPAGKFEVADMRSFSLGRKYDVVTCLFSSIGYARTLDGVRNSLECFGKHLLPGGVIIVEPWYAPDAWHPGKVFLKTAETPEFSLCRMSFSEQEGPLSRLRFEYLIGTPQGIQQEAEIHELGLFTIDEMLSAFARAGLTATYDPIGLSDRGLYLARRAA